MRHHGLWHRLVHHSPSPSEPFSTLADALLSLVSAGTKDALAPGIHGANSGGAG